MLAASAASWADEGAPRQRGAFADAAAADPPLAAAAHPPLAAATNSPRIAAPLPGRERLEIGAAFDSQDGPIGSAYMGKYNLIPSVFTFATFRYARETQQGQAGLLRPSALGERTDAGLNIQYRRDAYDNQGYAATTFGVEPYVTFKTAGAGVLTGGVGYRVQTVDRLAANAPPALRQDAGTRAGPYLRVSYTLDKFVDTDRVTLSTGVDNHLYNLGSGDNTLWRTEGRWHARLALVQDTLTLLNSARIGLVGGLGGGTPSVADRFFIGGPTLRGFAPRRVGPRDGQYFTGGNRYAIASLDLVSKIGTVANTPVSVSTFVDVGSLWGGNASSGQATDTGASVRASVGAAVTILIAGIPLSAYVAKAVRKEAGDGEQYFGVSVNMRF